MTTGWAIFMALILIAFAIGFFVAGYLVGDETARYSIKDERMHLIEAERQMHDLTRQAFIAMAEAAERHHRANPPRRRELPPDRP